MARLQAGDVLGMLTAVEKSERPNYWIWKCACGNVVEKRVDRVRSGYTKNCGCIRRPRSSPAKPTPKPKPKVRRSDLPTGIMYRSIPSRPKEVEPGPLSLVERTIIRKFADRPVKFVARLLGKPVRAVREQIKLMENVREAAGASRV